MIIKVLKENPFSTHSASDTKGVGSFLRPTTSSPPVHTSWDTYHLVQSEAIPLELTPTPLSRSWAQSHRAAPTSDPRHSLDCHLYAWPPGYNQGFPQPLPLVGYFAKIAQRTQRGSTFTCVDCFITRVWRNSQLKRCTGQGLEGSWEQGFCPNGVCVCLPPGTQIHSSTLQLSVASGFLWRLRHLTWSILNSFSNSLPSSKVGTKVALKVPNFFSRLGLSCDKPLSYNHAGAHQESSH